jgi:hypothetical protein
MFGCRAFVPEVVIVNRPPETYITGSPAETSGGYYHFHIWWHGTDADGRVERFVWALTDTSLQDYDTDEDEEDQRFNPALNISTLEIGNWTTRTDSIFDFALRLGPVLAANMTLHMVAVDDRGDFDRTPARLHFISNALGQPVLEFTKWSNGGSGSFADFDTIAYGEPFSITWRGSTPNIRSYDPDLLAERDTVGEIDGLFGFKYRILDEDCDESQTDCWKPRLFDETIGDSVSYFGSVDSLHFANEGPPNSSVQFRRLGSGTHRIMINTIDVAGVEVPVSKQPLNMVVNYDPDSRLLVGETDPFYSDDTHVYPYYLVEFPNWAPGGARVEEFTFAPGDTVPDRAVVVFKAIGRDDPRDLKVRTNQDWDVEFQGKFDAVGVLRGGSRFPFFTEFSAEHRTPAWEPTVEDGWSADTLSYAVGPFEYSFIMRSLDEHGRRDGSPDTLSFVGNFPPCVQCVEFTNLTATSSYPVDNDCWDTVCVSTVDTLIATWPPTTGPEYADIVDFAGQIYWNLITGEVWLDRPLQVTGVDSVLCTYFGYKLWLHGKDHPLEPPQDPEDRIMSWRYQVDYERDQFNVIKDGGGIDDLNSPTYVFTNDSNDPIYVDDNGVWIMRIKFGAPFTFLSLGEQAYRDELFTKYDDWDKVARAFDLTTMQLGNGTMSVIALDVAACVAVGSPGRDRTMKGKYHYFTQVRFPPPPGNGYRRKCFESFTGEKGQLVLNDFGAESSTVADSFIKPFYLKLITTNGEIFPVR